MTTQNDNENAIDADYERVLPTNRPKIDEQVFDDVADLLDGLSAGGNLAQIGLYRQTGNGREPMTFLDEFPSDRFDSMGLQRHIRDTYGTGTYRIYVKVNNKLIKGGNKSISVESKNTVEKGSDMKLLLLAMEQNNRALIEAIKPKNSDDNEEKFLEKMLKYKQLFGSGESSSGIAGIRESLKFVKDLGIAVGGQKEEKEPSILDSIAQLAPLLQAAIAGAGQNIANNNQQAIAHTTRIIDQHVSEEKSNSKNKSQKNTDEKKVIEVTKDYSAFDLRMGINILISAASKGLDQAAYAEMITGQLSAAVIDEVIFVDDWWKTLTSLAPAVEPHQEWFDMLREHVKAQFGMDSKVSDIYDDGGAFENEQLTEAKEQAINLHNGNA